MPLQVVDRNADKGMEVLKRTDNPSWPVAFKRATSYIVMKDGAREATFYTLKDARAAIGK